MKTILFVDDIKMNREFLYPTFASDYVIIEAESGLDALTILKSNHVDLIITDIFMEPMDGYSLIRNIRENKQIRDIPIIAVTEKDETSQAEAIAAGADFFVSRPMDSDELQKEVYRLTGQDCGRGELINKDFLLQSIPGAVMVYKYMEEKLKIVTCSRGLVTITGWDADEFSEKMEDDNFKKIHPSDEKAFVNMINKIINTKSRDELVYRGYKKDGSIVWLWFQGRYIGEEDGCPLIESMILDVSNNSNMYQFLLDQSSSLVTVVDAHTFEVLYANRAARDVVSVRPGEYIGNVCYSHVFGFDKPCSLCIVNHTNEDEYINENLEYGDRFYRQMFKRILWHGKEAIMEFTNDITEQKENIELVKKQKNMQDTILDTIPAGIMVFKFIENGIKIVSVNNSICEMMGIDRGIALGEASENIIKLTHPDDINIVLDAADKLRKEGTYVEYEYRHYYRSRNDYVWVLGQGRSVRDSDGYVYAYVNYTDITARKEVELLQGKLDSARIQAATKAEFYSQMSHDMRTPMNGILGVAELALEEDNVDEIHQDLEKIVASGRYMLNLINDTLDLQRMESGRLVLNPQIVKGREIIEDVVMMMRPSLDEKDITLNVTASKTKGEGEYVRVDALRIKQIIANILSNSVKYTYAGGTIDLWIGKKSYDDNIAHYLMKITDNGVGMSKEFLENGIFNPFSQERNEMSMKYPGSGLGLSIVKKLVEMMNGRIEVESELGKGSSFSIYLDIEIVGNDEVIGSDKKENDLNDVQKNIQGKHILLCEDHPLNAEIAKRLLAKVGCNVEWAENGRIGVDIFEKSEQGHFDAILMDIRMPVMGGLEATKKIRSLERSDARTIPIIAMSANAYEEDIKKSHDVGMNDHLAKPVNSKLLFSKLAEYIGI